jgi:RNA polymerase sigma factor (TIGR02999 family)
MTSRLPSAGQPVRATPRAACSDPNELYAAAYSELRRIARRERRRAQGSATINTTALIHETWFKLRSDVGMAQLDRGDFLAIAARAMRQVLIDHARRLHADKRRHVAVTLGHADTENASAPVAMLELDEALRRLENVDAQLARIVDLHVFCGLDFREIADTEGLSERTAFRLWRSARVFLLDQLAA